MQLRREMSCQDTNEKKASLTEGGAIIKSKVSRKETSFAIFPLYFSLSVYFLVRKLFPPPFFFHHFALLLSCQTKRERKSGSGEPFSEFALMSHTGESQQELRRMYRVSHKRVASPSQSCQANNFAKSPGASKHVHSLAMTRFAHFVQTLNRCLRESCQLMLLATSRCQNTHF